MVGCHDPCDSSRAQRLQHSLRGRFDEVIYAVLEKDLIGLLLGWWLLVLQWVWVAVGKGVEEGFEEESGGLATDQFFDHNYRL